MASDESHYYRARAAQEFAAALEAITSEALAIHRSLAQRYLTLADEAELAGKPIPAKITPLAE